MNLHHFYLCLICCVDGASTANDPPPKSDNNVLKEIQITVGIVLRFRNLTMRSIYENSMHENIVVRNKL